MGIYRVHDNPAVESRDQACSGETGVNTLALPLRRVWHSSSLCTVPHRFHPHSRPAFYGFFFFPLNSQSSFLMFCPCLSFRGEALLVPFLCCHGLGSWSLTSITFLSPSACSSCLLYIGLEYSKRFFHHVPDSVLVLCAMRTSHCLPI